MAREVSIDIDSVAGTVTITDVLNGSVRYSKICGLGEYSIDQNMADLTDPAAMVAPIHIGGESPGLFLKDDLTFFEINGVDQLPIADLSALIPLVAPFFFSVTGEFTLAELLAKQTAGTLPSGEWVKVSDICDRGGWLFCSSSTTIDESGFGLFLNAYFVGVGDTSGVLALTGVAVNGYAKWNTANEAITVTASNFGATPFTAGAAVADQSGWFGTVIASDNATYVTVYTSTGYLPAVGDFLDGGGTMTADVDAAAKNNATGTIYTYIDQTDADGTYLNYQLIDEELQDGTNPVTNTAAYTLLPKATAGMGYNLVSAAMSISLATSVVYRRVDDLGNEMNGTTSTAANNACYRFPWGDPTFTNCKAASGGTWNAHNSIGAAVDGIRINSGGTCGLAIGSTANVYGIEIVNGVEFSGKTIAAGTTIENLYVTADDVDTETLTYATWTSDGRRLKIVELTPTLLTTAFSVAGIDLLPALASDQFYTFSINLVNRGGGSEVYGAGADLQVFVGATPAYTGTDALLTTAGPVSQVLYDISGVGLQVPGASVSLQTVGNVDFTLVDVNNGSRCYAEVTYRINTVRP